MSALNRPESVLPPKYDPEGQTFNEVLSFIKSDDTNTIAYGDGFNCVDAALRVWRNAQWQGIAACPISVHFENPPHHMVVGFPTTDKGDVFFETLTDEQIRLRLGKSYKGKVVAGFYVMGIDWIPLDSSPELEPSVKIE